MQASTIRNLIIRALRKEKEFEKMTVEELSDNLCMGADITIDNGKFRIVVIQHNEKTA